MGDKSPIMVFIEWQRDHIADVSIELVCEAHRLAGKIGTDVVAVAMGKSLKAHLTTLGQYGCRRVHYIEDNRLADFTSVPYAKAMISVIQKVDPKIVLFGATHIGRDLAPRVASALKCGLTADCTALDIGEHRTKEKQYNEILLQIRPAFGGNILATIISPESKPSMATVRDGVMKRKAPDTTKSAEVVKENLAFAKEDFPTEILERVARKASVDLKSARIIVSAGMGACNPESMALVRELAAVLGAEVGASRPVVDSGLIGKDHQVGQTGTAVSPDLYIACGISGQIQHRVGIAGGKRIIAINEDPQAPIFSIADYGIVGDLNQVIPKLIQAYKSEKGV